MTTSLKATTMTTTNPDVRAAFKHVMAGVATPVSIVTTMSSGTPYGTTVSAFTSLSLNPPMVLVSLDRGSQTLASITHSGRFALNILAAEQTDAALAFAQKGGVGKFEGTAWNLDNELPRLAGIAGWIACTVSNLADGGDHIIALGHVVAAERRDVAPLTYHARTFGTHHPH